MVIAMDVEANSQLHRQKQAEAVCVKPHVKAMNMIDT